MRTWYMAMLAAFAVCAWAQKPVKLVESPRFWNDRDLADWAAPVAGINEPPEHFTEGDYYESPVAEWVRTYPVYFPGREPAGYWAMLQKKKPEPLVPVERRTQAGWIIAGKRVFEEMDVPAFRSYDPKLFALVRSAAAFRKMGGHAQKNGIVLGLRWVPTSKGLALSALDCARCHTRVMPDGSLLDGAPFNDPGDGVLRELIRGGDRNFFPGDPPGGVAWRAFAVPWVPDDINDGVQSMTQAQLDALFAADPPGTFARFNGSPYFPAQVTDLIGIGSRKYANHTATQRLRGPADLIRYAALVSCCDSGDFGRYQFLSADQHVILYRFPDDVLFALAEYLYALQPPKNPNLRGARAAAGKKIFEREGCGNCHTPPLYTNHKLTLAKGFALPKDHPFQADIMPVSVGTDPGLALRTRRGTGLYKVPSLKGLWYRGLLGHDGSIASLQEWFNPARLRSDYIPGGFKGYGVTHRSVPGHEYGLKLSKEDRAALIAFLKTL
ncbi:MAG TPA: hypothetical protein VG675_15070 [Bryobacteraceae bacterium]|nr:hypothetical protein [Bryobacteraceae bacterium]